METPRLSRREAAEYLTVQGFRTAPASLAKYASLGIGPCFIRYGRQALYRREDLDSWVHSRLSKPQAAGKAGSEEADLPALKNHAARHIGRRRRRIASRPAA